MTTCTDLELAMDELPLGTLASDELARVEAHVASCPACRERARSLERAYGGIGAAVAERTRPLSPGLRGRFLEALATLPACATCGAPVEGDDVAWVGRERRPHHVDCLAKARSAPAGPAAVPSPDPRVLLCCTFCHDRLARDEASFCASCMAPHHADCWAERGRCSAPGCGETSSVAPTRRSAPRRRVRLVLAVIGASLFSGAVAAVAAYRAGSTQASTGLLAAVRPEEIVVAEEELKIAEASANRSRKELERCEKLHSTGMTTEAELRGARYDDEKARSLVRVAQARLRALRDRAGGALRAVEAPVRAIPELKPGQRNDDALVALGAPDEVQDLGQGWRALCYRTIGARVTLDRDGRLKEAAFFGEPESDVGPDQNGNKPIYGRGSYRPSRWTYLGVSVGMPGYGVVPLLGDLDVDCADINGSHYLVFKRHGLVVWVPRSTNLVAGFVVSDDPRTVADTNGNIAWFGLARPPKQAR